jgi:hypothetical protein
MPRRPGESVARRKPRSTDDGGVGDRDVIFSLALITFLLTLRARQMIARADPIGEVIRRCFVSNLRSAPLHLHSGNRIGQQCRPG